MKNNNLLFSDNSLGETMLSQKFYSSCCMRNRKGETINTQSHRSTEWLLQNEEEMGSSPRSNNTISIVSYDEVCEFCKEVLESFKKYLEQFFITPTTPPNTSKSVKISPETKEKMAEFRKYTSIPYDSNDITHEATLQQYWDLCCPEEPLESRKSKQWKQLGFQGIDPASDFRGAGIFGLRCLVYFANTYSRSFYQMRTGAHLETQEEYPFSIAGLNVIMIIFDFLGWGFKRLPQDPIAQRHLISLLFEREDNLNELEKQTPIKDLIDFGEDYTSTSFFENESNAEVKEELSTEKIFFELFCYCFLKLHDNWYSRATVSYMDFPVVLSSTTNDLCNTLQSSSFTIDSVILTNRDNNDS